MGFLFSFPPGCCSVPHIVGPYSLREPRLANVNVPLFDYSAISNFRASREDVKASALSIKNARDLVVQAVGNAYLQIIADTARVTATQAEIDADNAVYMNAVHRHDAGTAIGIDVLRSQVELKQRQQTLVAVTNQFEKDKLTLGRMIGLPTGPGFHRRRSVAFGSARGHVAAGCTRKSLRASARFSGGEGASACRCSLHCVPPKRSAIPPLTASAAFMATRVCGLLYKLAWRVSSTGSIQFNIFDGGRIKGDILENDAELRNRRNEMENLRGQIDYEVRNALLDLKSAGDQVEVARSNMDLANQTLKQARDRFTAGVTNTVEVVQAQQAVADANENLISAQFQYNVAKVSLARALGVAEEGIRTYFNQKP